MRNFRNYKVWRDAVDFSTKIYQVTDKMPWFEKKGLCDQLQRASVSISSNIAEGCARHSDSDFSHFLDMALGSANEVETQLNISKNVGYIEEKIFCELIGGVRDIQKQISGLIKIIRK